MTSPLSICIFGNSHVAAYKTAEATIRAAHPDLSLTFFGVPWPISDIFTITGDGRFAPDAGLTADAGIRWRPMIRRVKKINEQGDIDLTAFDAVLFAGHDIRMRDILKLLAQTDVDGFAERGRPCLMSRAGFEAIIADIVDNQMPDDFANMAKAARCAIATVPHQSERCLDDPRDHYDDMRALAATPADLDAVMAEIDRIVGERFAALGITYIPQRAATTSMGFLSCARHSEGSRRLIKPDVEFDDSDYIHMNAAYAAESFNDFAAFARTAPAATAIAG